jgi:Family of unknown function (DUF6125)
MPNSLSSEMEKDLLVKGWMSHDARWFMAVTQHFGIDVANRMNQFVCREIGRVEMKRYMKILGLSASKDINEYLNLNKDAMSLYGHGLTEYEMHLKRCFAYENIVKAGIKDQYECGILARIQGWIDAQGLEHELTPPLGKCMMVLGKECSYTIKLKFD